MARKVFISFLGFSNYGSCKYVREDFTSAPVRFIQEATLQFLTSKETWTSNDVAYILLTDGAERANWNDNGHIDRNTHEPIACEGLKTRLEQASLPMTIKPVTGLPDGNNEAEIWEIFNRVYNLLEECDTLYFDLTHGFRYLPMLTLVLGNYAKFLKNATVSSITYGNFEGRNRDTNEALIVDLLPLNMLQEWTNAANNYKTCGNADGITELTRGTVIPILRATQGGDEDARNLRDMAKNLETLVDSINTCRGIDIFNGGFARTLQDTLKKTDTSVITPLKPIMDSIGQSIEPMTHTEDVKNALAAANWCQEHRLYQQAITILQEAVVTLLCQRNEIDVTNESERSLVNIAFIIKFNGDENNVNHYARTDHELTIIKKLLEDCILDCREIVDTFYCMTDVRNDFNHSGMRNQRMAPKKIKELIERFVSDMGNHLNLY